MARDNRFDYTEEDAEGITFEPPTPESIKAAQKSWEESTKLAAGDPKKRTEKDG